MTEPGGPAWRQTTFFHFFSLTSRLANGTSLQVKASGDTVDGGKHGEVPVVDSAATVEDGKAAVFLVNRHQTETTSVTIDLAGLQVDGDVRAEGVWDDDLHAVNDTRETASGWRSGRTRPSAARATRSPSSCRRSPGPRCRSAEPTADHGRRADASARAPVSVE